MPGGATVSQLGAGEKAGFALLTDGSLASWGYSQKGLILNGVATISSEYAPAVRNTTSIGQIARLASRGRCKAIHVVAQSGLVYFWGDGSIGISGKLYSSYIILLGTGSLDDSLVPVPVNNTLFGTQIDSIACEAYHCHVISNGVLFGWGNADST